MATGIHVYIYFRYMYRQYICICNMLYAICTFRSIIEPVRNTGFRHTDHYHHAYAEDLDSEKQVLHCRSMLRDDLTYELSYDKLIIGVGALSNTFGVPGVLDHAFFLKVIFCEGLFSVLFQFSFNHVFR